MGLDRTRPVILSDRSTRASDEFSHEIHLYADSHSNPEFSNDHVHTHTALKNDLLKEDLKVILGSAIVAYTSSRSTRSGSAGMGII